MGGATAAPNPPSTRAGGQDDGSLQTPSNKYDTSCRFAVDREFVDIVFPARAPWGSLGVSWVSLEGPWGVPGGRGGPFGAAWGTFWLAVGRPRAPCQHPLVLFGPNSQ